MPTSKTVRVSWDADRPDPVRFLAGASPREWERWLETGGMMPDMLGIARLLIEAKGEHERKEGERIAEVRRLRKNARQRAYSQRRKCQAA